MAGTSVPLDNLMLSRRGFDEDVIFLPEVLRAYDRSGVTTFLNQAVLLFLLAVD